MSRRGFTLVEALLAALLAVMLLVAVFDLLISGSKLFRSGLGACRGPDAAIMLLDHLEEDLAQILQAPGDPRPPAVVSDGLRVSFYKSDAGKSTLHTVVGVPASWDVAEGLDGILHPVRDGEVLEEIHMTGWSLELKAPSWQEQIHPGWYLLVEARFPTGGLADGEFVMRREIRLPQPSANFMHFLGHGEEILEDAVRFEEPEEEDPAFELLGAPPPGEHDEEEEEGTAAATGGLATAFAEPEGAAAFDVPTLGEEKTTVTTDENGVEHRTTTGSAEVPVDAESEIP